MKPASLICEESLASACVGLVQGVGAGIINRALSATLHSTLIGCVLSQLVYLLNLVSEPEKPVEEYSPRVGVVGSLVGTSRSALGNLA